MTAVSDQANHYQKLAREQYNYKEPTIGDIRYDLVLSYGRNPMFLARKYPHQSMLLETLCEPIGGHIRFQEDRLLGLPRPFSMKHEKRMTLVAHRIRLVPVC